MTSAGERHARSFLNLGDPDGVALDLLEVVLREAASDRSRWPALEEVERWTVAQLALLGVDPADALHHDAVVDVLAAVRLVAGRVPVQLRTSPARIHRMIPLVLRSLEEDFVSALLRETRQRVEVDPLFAADLADSRRQVTGLVARATALREDVVKGSNPSGSDVPGVLQMTGIEVGVAVAVIALLSLVTVWWVATEDPAKE